jgi:hypothetical protein
MTQSRPRSLGNGAMHYDTPVDSNLSKRRPLLCGRAVMDLRIVGALLIGGLIGLERSFHDRTAGFRMHSPVCVAALLMPVTVYQNEWLL